jgi:hypothetical protein
VNKEHSYIKTDKEQDHVCIFPLRSPYLQRQSISVSIATGLRIGILRSRILVTEVGETTAEYSLQWKQFECVTTDGGKNTSRAVTRTDGQMNRVS